MPRVSDLWAIVASVRQLPTITPESYAEMKAKAALLQTKEGLGGTSVTSSSDADVPRL